MKKIAFVLLLIVLLIGCGSRSVVRAEGDMFEEHRVENEHVILVDRNTEVCDERERYVYKDWHCLRWEKKAEE